MPRISGSGKHGRRHALHSKFSGQQGRDGYLVFNPFMPPSFFLFFFFVFFAGGGEGGEESNNRPTWMVPLPPPKKKKKKEKKINVETGDLQNPTREKYRTSPTLCTGSPSL